MTASDYLRKKRNLIVISIRYFYIKNIIHFLIENKTVESNIDYFFDCLLKANPHSEKKLIPIYIQLLTYMYLILRYFL